jgi:hypothetical protein
MDRCIDVSLFYNNEYDNDDIQIGYVISTILFDIYSIMKTGIELTNSYHYLYQSLVMKLMKICIYKDITLLVILIT